MNQTINLTLNPHYFKTFRFFILSFIGLFICGCYLIQSNSLITNRWDNEAIIAVHLFTLGFLLPIFLGSITQLLPVLFGIENNLLKTFDRLVYISPLTTVLFLYSFQHYSLMKNYFLLSVLAIFWFFLLYLAKEIIQRLIIKYREQKKIMYFHFMISIIYFILGLLASIWLVLVHFGLDLPVFRPDATNVHLILFILGFFYHLFIAISNHVIPMFFITQPIADKILKHQLAMPFLVLLLILSAHFFIITLLVKLVMTYLFSEYILQLFVCLKKRRRKSRDPSIRFWYLFFINCLMSLFLWIFMSLSDNFTETMELQLGGLIFQGVFLNLILAMLIKIIPFLIWQNLSQKQMEQMNFQTTLPTLNDFIPSSDLKNLFYLSTVITVFSMTKLYIVLGFCLIAVSLYLGYMLINALKTHQNVLIQLNDNQKTFNA